MYFKIKTTSLLVLVQGLLVVDALHLQKRMYTDSPINISLAPYHGSLFINDQYRCAAALIRADLLLTVAHHVDDLINMSPSEVQAEVLLGASSLGDNSFYSVKRISHHEEFTRDGPYFFPNDIAAIHLRERVIESDYIKPASLIPYYEPPLDETRVFVTGFGIPDISVKVPILHLMDLKLSTPGECQPNFKYGTLKFTNLCGFLAPYTKCHFGDGGAPVYAVEEEFLVGLVSYDTQSCQDGEAWPMTKLSSYFEYINSERDFYNVAPALRNEYPSIIWE